MTNVSAHGRRRQPRHSSEIQYHMPEVVCTHGSISESLGPTESTRQTHLPLKCVEKGSITRNGPMFARENPSS